MPKTLTIALLAKNETTYFEKALKSAMFADEIVVLLDRLYTEETKKIAEKYTKKVFINSFKDFATQKNLLVNKATSIWILLLDADEEISESLQKEIKSKLIYDSNDVAYQFKRKNIVFGKWIKHSDYYPDYQIRLFRKGIAKYEGVVHEQLQIDGRIGNLENNLIHHNYQTVSQFIAKQNFYSGLEAERVFADGRRFSLAYLFGKPIKEFFWRYFIKLGILDGWHGFFISYMMAIYRVIVAIKVWDLNRVKNIKTKI